MTIEAQMEQLIDAVQSIELESSSTVDFGVDTYNLVASIWEALDSIQNTLKKMEAKM